MGDKDTSDTRERGKISENPMHGEVAPNMCQTESKRGDAQGGGERWGIQMNKHESRTKPFCQTDEVLATSFAVNEKQGEMSMQTQTPEL